MNLVDRIGSKYQDMTENEKRVFDLMTMDVKGFALRPIGGIAQQLNISKTTLMRFAKKCGFKGYADFKHALQQAVILDVSPARKMEKVINSDYSLNAREICAREIDNIHTTFAGMESEYLERLIDMITAAEELHTLTWGVSGHIAEIFALRMRMMGIRCSNITRKHGTLLEETSLLREGDSVIVFEIPPYNQEVIDAVKRLFEQKVRVVLVTDSARCPVVEFATLSFFCPTDAMFFGNSLMGPLFWVNLVSSMVIYRQKEKVMGQLEEQQKLFTDSRYYCQ